MPVIARDAFAAGHLVYAWPFPIGPECEVSCRDDEQVVMCPAWTIGDRLGPGRHLWRTPDPTRPVHAYFVSHGSVDVEFEMLTRFQLPMNAQPIQIRASGTVLVRCSDPGVLIAQFIGLPFDSIDDGIRRSVARSVERMVARLLTRRVVMAGTIDAITDPMLLQSIIEEIVSYNPTAGAVFGIELSQLSRMMIEANDGHVTKISPPPHYGEGSSAGMQLDGHHHNQAIHHAVNGWETPLPPPVPQEVARHDTMRGVAATSGNPSSQMNVPSVSVSGVISGETGGGVVSGMISSGDLSSGNGMSSGSVSGVISGETGRGVAAGSIPPSAGLKADGATVRRSSVETLPPPLPSIPPRPITQPGAPGSATPQPPAQPAAPVAGPGQAIGLGGLGTPPPDLASAEGSSPRTPRLASEPDARSSILAIGARIGDRQVTSGEILAKVEPGKRVLVPGPHGLMQSATVRQLLSGYYELEVGASGETIWVPMAHVVPE